VRRLKKLFRVREDADTASQRIASLDVSFGVESRRQLHRVEQFEGGGVLRTKSTSRRATHVSLQPSHGVWTRQRQIDDRCHIRALEAINDIS